MKTIFTKYYLQDTNVINKSITSLWSSPNLKEIDGEDEKKSVGQESITGSAKRKDRRSKTNGSKRQKGLLEFILVEK